MPKTKPFRKLSIDEDICVKLEQRKVIERRQGSLTEYVSEILDWYLEGFLVRIELTTESEQHEGVITAAKIEPKAAIHERTKAG